LIDGNEELFTPYFMLPGAATSTAPGPHRPLAA